MELLSLSHAKRLLNELPGAFVLFAAKPNSRGFVGIQGHGRPQLR
jgi:hypothetical protein